MRRLARAALAALLAIPPVLCVRPAQACIGDELNSVHFHSGQPDFGRIPRRARVWETDDRHVEESFSGGERVGVELEDEAEREPAREQNRIHLLDAADTALRRGDWPAALRTYRQALARFGRSGTVRDRVEVLERALSMDAANRASLRPLLAAYAGAVPTGAEEKSFDAGAAGTALERVAADPRAGFLRERATYQHACLLCALDRHRDAVALFQEQFRQYPGGAKCEDGLIMLARCALLPGRPEERQVPVGEQSLDTLERRFPHSRFRRAALGLRGRAFYLTGRYGRALDCYFALGDMYSVEIVRKMMAPPRPADLPARLLAGYLRRLAAADTFYRYSTALADIERTRKSFTPADARRFSRLLVNDLSLPAPYFYYRLYHTETKPADIAQLAELAERITAAHPGVRLPPIVLARFGEVAYFRHRYGEAIRWAERALAADGGRTDVTPRALYMRGASRGKLRQYRAALADFNSLLGRFPRSPLRRGAREELAILYEAGGDLSRALDQYFDLGYQADIAFFLDGRMSIGEVERYLRTRPDRVYRNVTMEGGWEAQDGPVIPPVLRTHDLQVYTLGVRCLREERWGDAARWLRQLPRATYVLFSRGRREWDEKPSPDPLTAARELGFLQGRIARAGTANDRAAAMYRYASYYYSHGTLLLYVPPLWLQEREMHFQFYWNKRHATPRDTLAAVHYMHEHEVYAHALRVYEEIARRYPRSPFAPRALYRAACAAYHQSNLNEWWRDHDSQFGYQAQASRLMAALAHRYPRHPLAKEAAKFARVFAGKQMDKAQ